MVALGKAQSENLRLKWAKGSGCFIELATIKRKPMIIEGSVLHLTQSSFSNLSRAESRRRHLLILADEHARAMQAVRSAFQGRGWTVDTLTPTLEALGSIKRWLYDLVIMQITQPDMGNFALCEALRQHSRVPLLLIVSPAISREIIYAFHKGADAYVVEPFDLRELLARAEALIRRAEGRLR